MPPTEERRLVKGGLLAGTFVAGLVVAAVALVALMPPGQGRQEFSS